VRNCWYIVLLTVFFSLNVKAQHHDGYGVNLPKFYKSRLHFGFTIAGNKADFVINPKPNSMLPDTVIKEKGTITRYQIRSIFSKPAPGFAIGIVSDAKLHEYIRLRFTPSISFGSRTIEYTLSNRTNDSSKIFQKRVESAFLFFPIETKIQSKRLGNFSAYIIGGGGYQLDLAARKKAAGVTSGPNQLDDNVKLKRDDYYYSSGAGVDFYLQYFKLGFEVKLQIGTRNLLKPENSIFSNSIDKVRSRMVVFTVTFEG